MELLLVFPISLGKNQALLFLKKRSIDALKVGSSHFGYKKLLVSETAGIKKRGRKVDTEKSRLRGDILRLLDREREERYLLVITGHEGWGFVFHLGNKKPQEVLEGFPYDKDNDKFAVFYGPPDFLWEVTRAGLGDKTTAFIAVLVKAAWQAPQKRP